MLKALEHFYRLLVEFAGNREYTIHIFIYK